MAIALHGDDGIAVASSDSLFEFVNAAISKIYKSKWTRWKKILGYNVDIQPCEDGSSVVSVSAQDALDELDTKFLSDKVNPAQTLHDATDFVPWTWRSASFRLA